MTHQPTEDYTVTYKNWFDHLKDFSVTYTQKVEKNSTMHQKEFMLVFASVKLHGSLTYEIVKLATHILYFDGLESVCATKH